jgi:non-ribosomal peptide synthetase component F
VVYFEDLLVEAADQSGENLEIEGSPDQPMYVLFTSGSTGQPKAVSVPHRAVVNYVQWLRKLSSFTSSDIFLKISSVCFDATVIEVFFPLLAGSAISFISPALTKAFDAHYVVQAIKTFGITGSILVPPLLSVFLNNPLSSTCTSLRFVVAGGAVLPSALISQFYDRLPEATLFNFYGPTESTVNVTFWKCPKEVTGESTPIGGPIDHVSLYFEREGEYFPVQEGGRGELCVGGVCLALGYIGLFLRASSRFSPRLLYSLALPASSFPWFLSFPSSLSFPLSASLASIYFFF